MKYMTGVQFIIGFTMTCSISVAQQRYDAIYSGVPWFDDKGNTVSAHGACLVKEGTTYYLFGEKHSDTSNAFAGFNCYSSLDLYNWKFESIALPLQAGGKLGANRVGERVKVIKCPATGEYVMYMHVDTLGYVDQFLGYATSKTITGPYKFKGALLFNGNPVRKWDMGSFQDKDGTGYVLLHGGDIYKLNEDYKSIREHVNKAMERGFESPALFRKDSLYYFLGSDLTSWEKNDNYYFTAPSLSGPWTKRGFFAPAGTLTWNSQTTFVLPVETPGGISYLYIGDRWSFPRQASAATYVWQPLSVSGHSLSIPAYHDGWRLNAMNGLAASVTIEGRKVSSLDKQISYTGNWRNDTLSVKSSDVKGDAFSLGFEGKQIFLYGLARPNGGYAHVTIKNRKGKTVLSAVIDMYCKYPVTSLKFASPMLPRENYTLTVTVVGEHPTWSDKRKADYGSVGYFVSFDKIIVRN